MRNIFRPINDKEPPVKDVTLDWLVNNFGSRDTALILEHIDLGTGEFEVLVHHTLLRYRLVMDVVVDEPVIYL